MDAKKFGALRSIATDALFSSCFFSYSTESLGEKL